MHELTQRGIDALKTGDRAGARRLLAAAIDQDADDATAWLWLAAALTHDADRVACLRQVIRIDPQNQAARRGLAEILNRPLTAAPEPEPADETPVDEKPFPTVEKPISVVEKPLPTVKKPVPVVEKPLPVDEKPILVAEKPLPTVEKPTPVLEKPNPVADFPSPVEAALSTEGAASPMRYVQQRLRRRAASQAAPQEIFTTRPSQVPALICFWLFLFGAGGIGALLARFPGMDEPVQLIPGVTAVSIMLNTLVGFGLLIVLELLVVYALARNFLTQYHLTDQQLTARYHGRRVRLDIADLLGVETRQSGLQKITGTGDLHVEATIQGQLADLRLRNVTNPLKRAEQINWLIH